MYDVGGEVNYTTTALNDRPVFASSQGQGVTVRFTSGVGLGAKVESKGVTGIFSYSWFLGMVGYVVVGGLFGVVTGYVVLSGHWPTIGEVKELGSTALTTILQDGEGGDAAVQMVDHQLTTSVSVISFFQPVDILASLFSQTILSPVTNRPVTAVSIEQVAGFARSVGVADLSVLRSMFSQDPQFGELIVKITEELATKVSVECWAEVSWFWNVLVNSGVTEIRKSLINSGVTEVERAVLFDSMYVAFSDAAEVLVKSVSSFSDIGSVCPIELYVSYLENGGGCLVRCWESAFRALMIYSELVVW